MPLDSAKIVEVMGRLEACRQKLSVTPREYAEDVGPLLDERREFIALLVAIEWCGAQGTDGDIAACPACNGVHPDAMKDPGLARQVADLNLHVGHTARCDLDAFLDADPLNTRGKF